MSVAPLEYDTGNFLGVGVWPGQVSFAEAADFCRSHYGTDLASVHFQWQIDEITDSAFWAYIDHKRSDYQTVWFGGIWNISEPPIWPGTHGQWTWLDNTPFDPTFDDQFSVMVYNTADQNRRGNDLMCTAVAKGTDLWRGKECSSGTDGFVCNKYHYTFMNRGTDETVSATANDTYAEVIRDEDARPLTYLSDFDALLVEVPPQRESDYVSWSDSKKWCESGNGMSNVSLYSFQSDTELENLTSLTVRLVDSLNDSDWLLMQDMKVAWMDQPSLLLGSDTAPNGDCSSVDLILTDDPLSPQSDIGGSQNTLFYVADYNLSRSEDSGGCDGISDDGAGNNLRSFMCQLPRSSNEATNASESARNDPNLQFDWVDWLRFCDQVRHDYGSMFSQDCTLVQRLKINSNLTVENPPKYGDNFNQSTEYLLGWITIAQCDTWFENGGNHLKIPFDSQTSNHFWSGLWSYGASVKIRGISASDLSSTQTGSLSFCGGYDSSEEQKNSLIANRQAHNVGIMSVPYSWPIDNLKRGFTVSHEFDWLEYRDSNERYIFNDTNVRSVDDSRASATWIGRADFVSDNLQSNRDCVLNDVSDDDASGLTVRSLTRWKQGSFFVGTLNNSNVCTDIINGTESRKGLLFTSDRCTWSANNAGMSGFESKMPQFMQMQIGFRINRESFEQAVNLTGNVTCPFSNEELEQNGTLYYHTDCEVRKNVDDVNSEASDETIRIVSTLLDSKDKCETEEFDYASAAESLKLQSIPMMDINDWFEFCQNVNSHYRRRSSSSNLKWNMNQKCYTITAMFKNVKSQQRMKERVEWNRRNNISIPGMNGQSFGKGDILFINQGLIINSTHSDSKYPYLTSSSDRIAYYLAWIEVGHCLKGSLRYQKSIPYSSSLNDTLFKTIWKYGASVRISKRISSEVCLSKSVITKPFTWPVENLKRGFDISVPLSFVDHFDSINQSFTFDHEWRVYSSLNNKKYRRKKQEFIDAKNTTIWIGNAKWMRDHLTAGFEIGNHSSVINSRRFDTHLFYQPDSRYKGMSMSNNNCGFEWKKGDTGEFDHYVRAFYGIILEPKSVEQWLKNHPQRWNYWSSNDNKPGKQPRPGKLSEKKKKLRVMAGYVDCNGYDFLRTRFKLVKPMDKIFCMPLWILVFIGYISSMIIGWFSFLNMRYIGIDVISSKLKKNNMNDDSLNSKFQDKIHDVIKQGVKYSVESQVQKSVVAGISAHLLHHSHHYHHSTAVPIEIGQIVADFAIELEDKAIINLMSDLLSLKIQWAWIYHYTLLSLRVLLALLCFIAITIEYSKYNINTRHSNSFFFAGYNGIWWAFMYHPLFTKAGLYWYGMMTDCLGRGAHMQPEWMIWFEMMDLVESELQCSVLDGWYIGLVIAMAVYQWLWMGLLIIIRLATGISVFLVPFGAAFVALYWWSLCVPSVFIERRENRTTMDGCECTVNWVSMDILRFVFESHDEFMLFNHHSKQHSRLRRRGYRRNHSRNKGQRLSMKDDDDSHEGSSQNSNPLSSSMAPGMDGLPSILQSSLKDGMGETREVNDGSDIIISKAQNKGEDGGKEQDSSIEMVVSSGLAGNKNDSNAVELQTQKEWNENQDAADGAAGAGTGEDEKGGISTQTQLFQSGGLDSNGTLINDSSEEQYEKKKKEHSDDDDESEMSSDYFYEFENNINMNIDDENKELNEKRSCQDHLWQCVPFVCSLEESFNEEEHSRADLYRRHVLRKYIVHSLIIVAISTLAWFFYTPMSVASAVFLSQEEDWLGAVKYGFLLRHCHDNSYFAFDTSSWVAWTLLLSWLII